MSESLLSVANLRKSFGALLVVDDVSFVVAGGEVLGVMGPNGAGKTTMLNLVSGALRADGGRIALAGDDVTRLGVVGRCRRGVGRTHQVPRPFERMSVFENVLVGATNGGAAIGPRRRDRYRLAADAIERSGLSGKANRLAGSLPLLDRKRLELARALATAPRVLLLDEIAGGLTEPEVQQLVALVLQLRESGLAIVWIEHVVHALMATVDRLMALTYGRVIAQGEPRAVMASEELQQAYLGTVAP
ncbi:MAG: ABC transporter ATP-binding protein [Solirubrobacteraceae bacterium]